MANITIYHNPRCSKSRRTLELLRRNGVEPDIVEYLKDPVSLEGLRRLLKALKCPASALVRSQEAEYAEAGLDADSADDSILDAIVQYPKLLERPIVVKGDRAVMGRPPENVLDLL